MTIQDLGWRPDGRYLARSDDIACVAYWYSEDPAGMKSDFSLDSAQGFEPARADGREHEDRDRQLLFP